MKVRELIELLKTFPQDVECITEDYGEGLRPLDEADIELCKGAESDSKKWCSVFKQGDRYYRRHEITDRGTAEPVTVVRFL